MTYRHQWDDIRSRDPEHSQRYAQRWKDLAAAGHDIFGEARFIDAMAARGSRILDAGCGTGRVGGYLLEAGHAVAGVDLDEILIDAAQESYPAGEWFVGDLATFDLRGIDMVESPDLDDPSTIDEKQAAEAARRASLLDVGTSEAAAASGFDIVVSAGNVMTFLDPTSRVTVFENFRDALLPDGRLVTGFGAQRGYDFDEYIADLATAGLRVEQRFSTWNLDPFDDDSHFLVCVSRPVGK